MKQLSPEARKLFRLARPGDEPNARALRRVESSLAARIATIATLSTATTAASTLPLVKIMATVGLAATLTGVGWWTTHHRANREEAPLAVSSQRRPSASAPRLPNDLPTPVEGLQPATTAEPAAPIRSLLKPRATPAATGGPPAPADDPLHSEIRDLYAAQQALRAGEGTKVLALLNQQDRAHPGGALQEERAAARVLALCQTGQVKEARLLAQSFEQRYPRSSLLARLKNSCWSQ
jgi:hypothetical protein